MRTVTRWFGLMTTLFVLAAVPALADPARGGASANAKAHGPKAVKSSTVKTQGPSAGPKTTSKAPTVKSAKSTTPKGNSATAKTKNGTTTSPTTTSNTTSGSTTTSSSGTGSTVNGATWVANNAVAQKLSTKPNILKKVSNSLPVGTDLNGATSGFKNFGQFMAAINVSNNHQIAFADLKAAMTGLDMNGLAVVTPAATGATSATTAVTTMSLGQAMQTLKPGVDAETVAQTALTQANQEINSSPTTTTTTSSTSTASTSTTGTKAKPKSKS